MANFQYCPLKKCAIETMTAPDSSVSSSIDTNNSTAHINQFFSECGLSHDFDKFPHEIEFDLSRQLSLHIGADIYRIIGDCNGDSSTTKTDCSAATLHFTKSNLPTLIDYLTPVITPVPPSSEDSTMSSASPTASESMIAG